MMSQAIRSFVEDMSSEEHGPRDTLELEGEQPKAHEVQERVEHAYGAHEKPSYGQDERVEEAVKSPDTEPEKRPRRRREKLAGVKPRISKRENERRLEGQLREFERKREAHKKAKEDGAARARGDGEEHSNLGKSQQRNEEGSSLVQRQQQSPGSKSEMRSTGREDAKKEKPNAAAKVDDQNVDVETAAETLDTHAAPRLAAISDDEHFHPHLMKYSALAPAVPLASPSPSITPRDSTLAFAHCPYENSQTGVQSDYLFNPSLQWTITPTLTPAGSAQTRENATDVLFDLSLEQTGDPSNSPIPKVKICHTAIDHARGGAYRNARGSQGNRGQGSGIRGRRKGGRGPPDKTY